MEKLIPAMSSKNKASWWQLVLSRWMICVLFCTASYSAYPHRLACRSGLHGNKQLWEHLLHIPHPLHPIHHQHCGALSCGERMCWRVVRLEQIWGEKNDRVSKNDCYSKHSYASVRMRWRHMVVGLCVYVCISVYVCNSWFLKGCWNLY